MVECINKALPILGWTQMEKRSKETRPEHRFLSIFFAQIPTVLSGVRASYLLPHRPCFTCTIGPRGKHFLIDLGADGATSPFTRHSVKTLLSFDRMC